MRFNRKLNAALLGLSLTVVALAANSSAHSNKEIKAMIDRSTPILHVKAVEPSVKFWTERFGFKTTITVPEGDHIGFAALESGSIELMFQTYQGMKSDASLSKAAEQGPSFIFMEVPDINAVNKALEGAEIIQGIHESSYGAKEIVAREPGGHFVIFSQLPKQ